jgi:carbon monoxide dehydrogenase subunit G
MTRVHERIDTVLPIDDTFSLIGDFANAEVWDPGVVRSRQIGDGRLAVAARYHLDVRMGGRVAPMEYRVTELERPRRVVLVGSGSGVDAVDEIRFDRVGSGTRIEYIADIRLRGWRRFVQPFLGRVFDGIGRDAANGMRAALDERAIAGGHES